MELRIQIKELATGAVREVLQPIEEQLSIGRSAGDGLQLDGSDVSRPHCTVECDGDRLFITDHSRNGTFLNGARIAGSRRTPFSAADVVGLPGYELRFFPPGAQLVPATTAEIRAAAKKSPLAPVAGFWRSFTFFEKFSAAAALLSLAVLAAYWSF